MPLAPPTTVTRPRSPLCIVGVSFGSRAPAHTSVTSRGQRGSAGGRPMATATILPPHPRARTGPRRGPPHPSGSPPPPIAAVVPRPGDDQGPTGQHRGVVAYDQVRDRAARGLHQHAGGNPVLCAGGRIPGGGLGRGQHRDRVHGITTPPYPTTASSSPVTMPEWL